MPRGDQTGPNGMGPKTGRAMGFCAGFRMPGFENQTPGGGFGQGLGMGQGFGGGRGRGFRNRYFATGQVGWARGGRFMQPELPPQPAAITDPRDEEIRILKSQSEALLNDLTATKERLAVLEGTSRE